MHPVIYYQHTLVLHNPKQSPASVFRLVDSVRLRMVFPSTSSSSSLAVVTSLVSPTCEGSVFSSY